MLGNLFSIVCKLSEDSSLPRDLSEDICQKSFDHKCCKPHYCIWVSKHMSWGGRDSLYFFCVWVIIHLRDWAMYAKKVFCYWSLDCVVFFFQVYLFLCVLVFCLHACLCKGATFSGRGVAGMSCHVGAGNSRSSGKTDSILNCWAISQLLDILYSFFVVLTFGFFVVVYLYLFS